MFRNIRSEYYEAKRYERKVRNEYLRRTRKLTEIIFCSRNQIKGINIRIVSIVRYSGYYLNYTRAELRDIEGRALKRMYPQCPSLYALFRYRLRKNSKTCCVLCLSRYCVRLPLTILKDYWEYKSQS